jgi:OmpA-OmpF porin, OOP family
MRFAMRHIFVLFVPLALLGCGSMGNKSEAPGPAAQATGIVAQQDRITYTPVLADRKNIEALQERLRKLNEAGIVQNNYSLAKAQCWLDTAKTQYHENDRTGYIEESMTESQKIIQALEANKAAKVGYETPLVARSSRLRDDLWADLSKFKSNETTLACNARTVACAEVRLVRAGHADEQTGWRAATPHVMMAEDGIRRASQEAASCAAPAVAAVAPRAAPAPAPAPAPVIVQSPAPAPIVQTITRESFVLLGDTLFKFNKSGINDLLPGGIERLNGIAQRLKTYQSLSTMRIVGHTDRYGSEEYNNDLSTRRASTVRTYLESQGIRASKTEVSGMGESQPVTKCSTSAPRAVQIACLQADRRVNIDVTGFVK